MARRSYKGDGNPNFKHGSTLSPYEAKKLHKAKYPERVAARNIVYQGIKYGTIVRMPCEVCGNEKSEAHHEDYSKPKEIKWLCRKHHLEAHGNKWREY